MSGSTARTDLRTGPRDVVVIGGGVAGLVAARECARIGLRVTLLEAADAVGGAVASHTVGGLTLDSGAESFAVRAGAVADFVASLGLTEQIVMPNSAGAWLCLPGEGREAGAAVSVPLPRGGVLGIPSSPLAADVRAVIGWGGAWRAYLDRLMPVLKIGREHNLGELVQKRMGRRVLERLVDPVAAGVYSAPATDLEVDVVAPGLNSALTTTGSLSGAVLALIGNKPAGSAGSAVGGLRGGMSTMVTALVAELAHYGVESVTDARVQALERSGTDEEPTWTVTIAPPAAQPPAAQPPTAQPPTAQLVDDADLLSTLTARFVIVATSNRPALDLVAPLSDELATLTELDWPEPTAVELATVVIDAPSLDAHQRGTGVLVAAATPGISAKALTHVSAKWDWVAEAAGPGRHVLRLSYGRAGEPGSTEILSDAEFQALALHDAARILGVPLEKAAVVGFARTPWHGALSPATIGARERVHAVREVLADVEGLELTGAWLSGVGLAAVIPDALAAAGRIRHAALGMPSTE
nr:FAD-dependent oxidoreductase [Leifsonia psychrotolerans]